MPEDDFLILTKTYPNPSNKYRETVCVVAMTRKGELCRLYPISERLLSDEKVFSKWDWIHASWSFPTDDKRPDSKRIDTDSIHVLEHVGTERYWSARLELIRPHIVDSYQLLEERRLSTGQTLGIVAIHRLLKLDIKKERNPEWTQGDIDKLTRDGLFDSERVRNRPLLRKLPYRFYYSYACKPANGAVEENHHLITDWELGALFWHCHQGDINNCLDLVRQKYETEFSQKDLRLLMGTVHRFPNQWLIAGIMYPPRRSDTDVNQLPLPLE